MGMKHTVSNRSHYLHNLQTARFSNRAKGIHQTEGYDMFNNALTFCTKINHSKKKKKILGTCILWPLQANLLKEECDLVSKGRLL